jgi:hypothetical protein
MIGGYVHVRAARDGVVVSGPDSAISRGGYPNTFVAETPREAMGSAAVKTRSCKCCSTGSASITERAVVAEVDGAGDSGAVTFGSAIKAETPPLVAVPTRAY